MQQPKPMQGVREETVWMAGTAAIALPTLIAFNLPPSATFFNQAAALIGWGGLLLCWFQGPSHAGAGVRKDTRPLIGALALLLGASIAAPLWTHQPWSLALSSTALIAAALLVAITAATLRPSNLGPPAFRAFCIALVVAGIASSLVGIIQVYIPQWADGNWIAVSGVKGSAVGNMRQPNHLSSLLLWSVIAAVWLGETRIIRRAATAGLAALFMFVVVLTASRTGALGALLLAAWGLLDRRLSRASRTLLLLAPVAYGLFWLGNTEWAHLSDHAFRGENRFTTQGDVSSSRFAIWSNTLSMIAAHPWFGVGWGEFNYAWTLTPFPGRPTAFFDHTHNLPLQLAVEMGIPLATLVMLLLLWALYRAWRQAVDSSGDLEATTLQRAALMIVLMIGLHSLLEYPLWYAYFLLPAAFAFGLCLGTPSPAPIEGAPATGHRWSITQPLAWGAIALIVGGAASLVDYYRVVVIFAPPDGAAPLAERIEAGQHSWFFSHHADYAAATTANPPSKALPAFSGASHYLLDARLMAAWAQALHGAGDEERARFVAQRLMEFRNDQSAEFFEDCAPGAVPAAELPFQCLAPTARLGYEDFRR